MKTESTVPSSAGASKAVEGDPSAAERAVPYAELLKLEPRLKDLADKLRAVRDEGGPFFCSNFVWLPLNAELKGLIGVARAGRKAPGDPQILSSSFAYETAYIELSPLLPPCRDCGCVAFEPWLKATWTKRT